MADRPLFQVRKLGIPASLILAFCCSAGVSPAAAPIKMTGSLLGSVKDAGGVPQIGATVLLFNRYDRVVQKGITNLRGEFLFDALSSDVYSIRVTMSNFVPALKRNILVQPGMQSVLAINLASVLSSIELVYSAPKSGALMSDDWKWSLRTAMDTRPVLRALPTAPSGHHVHAFSDTTGLLRVSSGETSPYHTANQPDLGTAFALATSLFGNNRLQFSGNVGYAPESAGSTTGFRTTFSRNEAGSMGPEVKLTVQQAALPLRTAAVVGAGQQQNAPALRTMTLTMIERVPIMDGVELEYGASLESVTFFDRLNFFSPFARLSYDIGSNGKLSVGYSSGAPPVELLTDPRDPNSSLQQDLQALSLLPRVSLRDGRAHVQRTENLELGYQLVLGSRTVTAGVYREIVRNGAVTISGADDAISSLDLLPELSSRSSVFNVGGFQRMGYSASVSQALGDNYNVTLLYGSGDVLRTDDRTLDSNDAGELRSMMRKKQQQWAAVRVSGVVPVAGTRVTSSYQWTDYRSLTPSHVFFTQRAYADAGLNLRVRQPIPAPPGFPGRLEASAELRNMLAQGYLPITTTAGRRMVLTHSPRAVRGGLSLIF